MLTGILEKIYKEFQILVFRLNLDFLILSD